MDSTIINYPQHKGYCSIINLFIKKIYDYYYACGYVEKGSKEKVVTKFY